VVKMRSDEDGCQPVAEKKLFCVLNLDTCLSSLEFSPWRCAEQVSPTDAPDFVQGFSPLPACQIQDVGWISQATPTKGRKNTYICLV